MTTAEVRETSPTAQEQKDSLGVKKEGPPPHNKDGHTVTGLCCGIRLNEKLSTHVGEDPGPSQV